MVNSERYYEVDEGVLEVDELDGLNIAMHWQGENGVRTIWTRMLWSEPCEMLMMHNNFYFGKLKGHYGSGGGLISLGFNELPLAISDLGLVICGGWLLACGEGEEIESRFNVGVCGAAWLDDEVGYEVDAEGERLTLAKAVLVVGVDWKASMRGG